MKYPIDYKALDRQVWLESSHTRRLAKAIRNNTLRLAEAEFRVACEKTPDPKVAAAYATLLAVRATLEALEGGQDVGSDSE